MTGRADYTGRAHTRSSSSPEAPAAGFPIFPAGGAGRGPRLHLTSATACMMPGNIRFRVARQNEIGSLRDMRSGTRFWRALSAAPFTRARLFPAMVSRAESFGLESPQLDFTEYPRAGTEEVLDGCERLERLAPEVGSGRVGTAKCIFAELAASPIN